VAKRNHIGGSSGFNKNVTIYENSFAPFLSKVEYLNCGKFGQKREGYKHKNPRHSSHMMQRNETTQLVKMRRNNGADGYKFVFKALFQRRKLNRG